MSKAAFAFLVCTPITLAACSSSPEDDAATSSDELTMTDANARVIGTGGAGLRVRSEPNTSGATVAYVREGAPIAVTCRTRGQAVSGNPFWDYLEQYRGFVSDRYVALDVASVPDCENGRGAPVSTAPSPRPASANGMQAAIVAEARRWIGTRASAGCQPFSTALGRPCEPWCADFVAYVWQASGADIGMLTAWAGTFFDYGQAHGTIKPRNATDVAPGDAVVFGQNTSNVSHVGIVVDVLANGDLAVVNGNWSYRVLESRMTRDSVVGGYRIGAFVSPVPR